MELWTDLAEWRGPTVNHGSAMIEHRGAVVHTASGYGDGTVTWQKKAAAQVSSHFVIFGPRDVDKGFTDGHIAQVVPCDITAWTQQAGNGHWISLEFSGFGEALSEAQLLSGAKLFARGHRAYGWPLQIATSPTGKGLGHHSMGTNGRNVQTDIWTGPTWGHEQCPGKIIAAQKPTMLALAVDIVNGTQREETVDRIAAVTDPSKAANAADRTTWYFGNGIHYRKIVTWPEHQDLIAAGAVEKQFNTDGDWRGFVGRVEAIATAPVAGGTLQLTQDQINAALAANVGAIAAALASHIHVS